MLNLLLSAWRFRFFIISSIKTEFFAKFIRSRLGGLWIILNPLIQVMIFAFILSAVLSAKLPNIDNQYAYAIYLMAGTLGWSLFAEIVNRCLNLFIENSNIIKKLVFPKIALPIIVTGSALINNLLLLAAILVIFGFLGHTLGAALIWLPFLMILTVALALGIGLICGVLNVFIRDVGQIIPVVMQLLFWLTPIVYMSSILPQRYQNWLTLNPLYAIITGYQNILLYNQPPDWSAILPIAFSALILLVLSLFLFRKASAEMVDQL